MEKFDTPTCGQNPCFSEVCPYNWGTQLRPAPVAQWIERLTSNPDPTLSTASTGQQSVHTVGYRGRSRVHCFHSFHSFHTNCTKTAPNIRQFRKGGSLFYAPVWANRRPIPPFRGMIKMGGDIQADITIVLAGPDSSAEHQRKLTLFDTIWHFFICCFSVSGWTRQNPTKSDTVYKVFTNSIQEGRLKLTGLSSNFTTRLIFDPFCQGCWNLHLT